MDDGTFGKPFKRLEKKKKIFATKRCLNKPET